MAGGRKPEYLNVVGENADFEPDAAIATDGKLEYIDPPELVRLNDVAHAEWKRIVPLLAKKRYLDELDVAQLSIYCLAVAEFDDVTRRLLEDGFEFWSEGGRNGAQLKTDPKVFRRNELVKMIRSLASEFGMSPYSRMKLAAPSQGDLWDELDRQLPGGAPRSAG